MLEERFHEAINQAEWRLIILVIIIAGPLIAQRFADTIAGISLIVAAGPYRLNLTSAECSPEAQALLAMSTTG